ncbi:hypothetical protein MYU51_006985 [Penicillium brevicompactum]|uniref:uncharacterized protein n=1 Tax=Penicillium brevicompactum TaxID=5074 RepID=UPI002540A76A|nr:uncharacterized protein N7506_002025 [Penicillium brevicompactum]KAJ5348772.1 hypothetical protein N7506_002025 [Penicillium brevicompactum]
MAPALTTAKRPYDPVEESARTASKRHCGDPTEPQLRSPSDSSAEPSLNRPKDQDTEKIEEDKRLLDTIRFLEEWRDTYGNDSEPRSAKCAGGPLAGRYDYRRWASEMKDVFIANGVMEVIEGKLISQPPGSPLRDDFLRVEAIARHLLGINVTESNRALLWQSRCPYEFWDKLRKTYQLSPFELSLEGWSLMKEKKISQFSSALEYTSALSDAWRQVCMDRDDMFQQTQPILCTALLHGLDGLQWSLWKNNLVSGGNLESDFETLAGKVRESDPLMRGKSKQQRPMLK